MIRAFTRIALLALVFTTFTLGNAFIKDELTKPAIKTEINKISDELGKKTGIKIFVIATNDTLPKNLVEYTKQYDSNLSKPNVILIFAPTIKRVAVVASSSEIQAMYDSSDVKDAFINVVRDESDGNTNEDKYSIGIYQSVSELADQIAKAKNVNMSTTIPNDTHYIISVLRVIVWGGALIVFWIFGGQKLYKRIRYGKQQ